MFFLLKGFVVPANFPTNRALFL